MSETFNEAVKKYREEARKLRALSDSEAEKDISLDFRGSANQRILRLKEQ